MLELWREYATEQEIEEYERLGNGVIEIGKGQAAYLEQAAADLGIAGDIRKRPAWDDDKNTMAWATEVAARIRKYTPSEEQRAFYLEIISRIEKVAAACMRDYWLPQADITSTCYKRYKEHIDGLEDSKKALLDDAKRIIYSFVDDLLDISRNLINKGNFDAVPREIDAKHFYIGGGLAELLNAAGYCEIDIESDLQNMTEQAAKDYGLQAKDLLKQARKKKAATTKSEPLAPPLTAGSKEKQALIVEDLIKSNTYIALNSKTFNQYMTIQNDMLSINSDGQMVMFAQDYSLQVSPEKAPAVYTYVSLTYDGELAPKLAKLTAYDKCVLNALCTIWKAGNRLIKVDDIYKVMNGNTDKKPSPATHEKIKKALKKLNNTWIYIDYSQELANNYLNIDGIDERIEKASIEGHLIDIYFDTKITSRGRAVDTIAIGTPPILLAYSELKKNPQIISIPMGMLNTKSVSATDDISVIREYLAKQVIMLKNKKGRNNNKILYSTLLSECTIEVPEEPAALSNFMKRERGYIVKILEEWQANGFIKSFQEEKTGKQFTGITITV